MKNISVKIVVLFAGLVVGVNAAGSSDLPDCPAGANVYMHDCFGTYTYADGTKYVGEYKDGEFNGQGTITYASGDEYVGKFRDGDFNGQGTITYSDGSLEEGIWKDGNFLEEYNNN